MIHAPLPNRPTTRPDDFREKLYAALMTVLTTCLFPLVFLIDGSDQNSARING
jgi:hypothetical protein